MAEIFSSTAELLAEHARTHDRVLVSFSGGKESLVVADLCSRLFPHMIGFFMYLVPGLRVIEEQLDYGRKRWGLKILYYPHWSAVAALRYGVYVPTNALTDQLPSDYSLTDVYSLAREDTGIELIANGMKKADSEARRKNTYEYQRKNVLTPLRDWNKLEVLSYLALHKIPLPKAQNRNSTAVDLTAPSLCWLHDNYPDDFAKVQAWFPYVGACVARRDFFGVR